MKRRSGTTLLALMGLGFATGAAPLQGNTPPPPLNASKAAPSYYEVSRAIAEITQGWDKAGAEAPPSAPGWRAFFDALNGELAAFTSAEDDKARLVSLGKLHEFDMSLWATAWAPSTKVRTALDEWLTPRVRLAWAGRRLIDFVEEKKAAAPENAEHWKKFVGDDLSPALAGYEGAKTVQARLAAMKHLTGVLGSLRENNKAVAWPLSSELQSSVDGLYNRPNLDVSADVASVSPFLANDVMNSGPIERGGYVSQVTAGPRTGFGLLPSNEGIAFFNSQLATTVTPITDFQQQLEQDKKGRKVAKLYQFGAMSYDQPELTINAIIRPSTGLSLSPVYAHNINAAFDAAPIAGKGLARGVLAVLGLNREKLTDKVGQQAYPRIAQGVVEGANEEAAERIPGVVAQTNSGLSKVLIGNNTLAIKDFRVTDVTMQSLPTNALIGGVVGHKDFTAALGADMPQPSSLAVPAPGLSVDVHLGSTMSRVVEGLLAGDEVKGVDNLMIVTKAVEAGAPAKDGVTIGKNVDYPTFLKNIAEAQAANNPKVTAIRIKKPTTPPEFAADARGYLVILVRDFQMEVPAPAGGLLGANAKVLRFMIPTAEFVLSFKVVNDASGKPGTLDAKVEDLVWGSGSKVQTIGEDESQAAPMGPFQANIALAGFRTKLEQVPIQAPLSALKIPGFDLAEVSPLDPSGWIRVVLTRNGEAISLPKAQAENPSPGPTAAVEGAVAR